MTKNSGVHKKGQIKGKIQYGDYITLAAILGCTPDAARKRLSRGNEQVKETLLRIIENREQLINEYRSKINNE